MQKEKIILEFQGETEKYKNKIQNNKWPQSPAFLPDTLGKYYPNEMTLTHSTILYTQALNFGDILPMRM